MLIDRRQGSVHPDYFQFYLRTGGGEYASDQISSEGYEIHLESVDAGFVYVGTLKTFMAPDRHRDP